ncbi:MAG: hypothetical protein AABO41_15385 [Acidobacteriota bacterium]
MKSDSFSTGYVKYDLGSGEDFFLSVTPGFELGPGIQRDGVLAPHMTDPHCVGRVCGALRLKHRPVARQLVSPYEQRAGTWTVYHHLKHFSDTLGKEGWQIIGAQGHGDLTMNYWHVAFCNQPGYDKRPKFCRLETKEDDEANEPFHERAYRCLVKWREKSRRQPKIEFRTIHFHTAATEAGVTVHLADDDDDTDVTREVAVAMAGKTIIENGTELSLDAIINRFDDVRHIFRLPEVEASGYYERTNIDKVIFGEYELFRNLNVRRAALHAPVLLPLDPAENLTIKEEAILSRLDEEHFRKTSSPSEIPTLRGQYRHTSGHGPTTLDVFLPRNVYPFGVIGTPLPRAQGSAGGSEVICLSSGGLSGRIGNTLEGITRVMYDFLACGEAMVLDEGLDVFQLVNPTQGKIPQYSNQQLLSSIAQRTNQLVIEEEEKYADEWRRANQPQPLSLHEIPLNKKLFAELASAETVSDAPVPDEVFPVSLKRSQIRAVLIFAKKLDK